jgi:hypothetical protein
MLLLPMAVMATPTYGIAHFGQSSNFDAYTMGNGKIHFKILIYGKGTNLDGYAGNNNDISEAYAWTKIGEESPVPFLYYHADDGRNHVGRVAGVPEDQAVAYIRVLEGLLVVTNVYEGDPVVFGPSDTVHEVFLTRTQITDNKAYLEFDWYPSVRLVNSSFIAGVHSKAYTGDHGRQRTDVYNLGSFTYNGDQQPQLMDPVFYPVSNNGSNNYGYLAVPYISFQQVYQYYTSWNASPIPCTEQGGMFSVKSADSVQRGFYVVMQTKTSSSSGDVEIRQWLRSNKVDIPAYHKIHNFTVAPYTWQDTTTGYYYSDPRYKTLSWKVYFPYEEDVMSNDLFELQRAYDSSFADAQTIATIPMTWEETDSIAYTTYIFVDSASIVGSNATVNSDSVYYRVRRASASVWGWKNHDYAAEGSAPIEKRLITLRPSGCKYSKDPDFDNNHKVNLIIDIWNNTRGREDIDFPRERGSYWDPNATLYIKKVLIETGDTILIRVPTESINSALNATFYAPSHAQFFSGTITVSYVDELNTPCNHVNYFYYIDTEETFLRQRDFDIGLYGDVTQVRPFILTGTEPYFTDAGNLNSLTATHGDYPDRVLITWVPTEGAVDNYTIETRPDSSSVWTLLGTTTNAYWNDVLADPSVTSEWQYRVTMNYTCQGTTVSDSRTTTGSRSPWGRVSGRVHYEDGSGCPGITVVATRTSDGATVQTVLTDASGYYMLDSLPYGGNVEYTITPTSQTAQFHYNNTSSGFATVNLSLTRCITTGIDFDNISAVRLTGRVLYENSSIPVRDANFLLNGNLVSMASSALKTDASGNFELRVPEGSAFTLQVIKAGHHFAGDGFIRINNDSLLTLNVALDGVRLWDQTKVRLAGRVAGGLDQRNLPLGFGLSTNNLGDNLRLVFELEGDNISYIVRVPSDLTKDTLEFTVPHLVYGPNDEVETVGVTQAHYQQKRIIVEPDPVTGEFCVDLFPVRYKITQATATGYATLFSGGLTSVILDLGNAATQHDTVYHNSQFTIHNSQYKLTYRSPISITCKQMVYGMEMPYFGDQYMQRVNIKNEHIQVPLAYKDANGVYQYLFGAPVFSSGDYSFRVFAHEDYYYNNDINGRHDEVRIKGGTLKVYNGMHENENSNTQILTKELDTLGQADFTIPIDYVSFVRNDENVQRVLDLSVESEGEYVELQAVRGYVTGHRITGNEVITSTHGKVQLLDVLRDPPGSASYSWLEAGTEYTYSYTYAIDFRFGVEIGLEVGGALDMTIGAWVGVGGGMFTGQDYSVGHNYQFSIPIVGELHHKTQSSYTFKTTERISTSDSPYHVGQDADVYIGLVQNMYSRRIEAVQPIDSLTYATLGGQSSTGLMPTVAEGVAPDSTRYYLVIGKELEMRPDIASTFIYTHHYIENTLIPRLIQERDALLLTCDSATAQSIADAGHKVVFQSLVPFDDPNWAAKNYYRTVLPQGFTGEYVNSVDSINRLIADWGTVLLRNEMEKVSAIHNHEHDSVATYSLSYATSVTRSDSYSYSDVTHSYLYYPGMDLSTTVGSIANVFRDLLGTSVGETMLQNFVNTYNNSGGEQGNPMMLAAQSPGYKTSFIFKPVLDLDISRDPAEGTVHERTVGFSLIPDEYSTMDVSIYRIVNSKDQYNTGSSEVRDNVASPTSYNANDKLYGSLVFYLRGGATKCPCELPDSTDYYVPKTPISAGSLRLENPKVDINVHERSNVPADQPAIFTLYLYNELEPIVSLSHLWVSSFRLKMQDRSNPHGARIYIDGMPLTDGRIIELTGDEVVTKTMEVYAGDGYDYEDLVIELGSTCISTYRSRAQFSVHFMPVSCDVRITSPRDNWVMNTLSSQDSVGYYLPVSISDFDVNYRGFDHIELQYKLSTQSDDGWVNLCSYYADSALFAAASGNKAMIQGGRIENVRFYGERDPMEQRYDLRAVSFCRHGSGFISKASEIKSGIKDTRCPRVFGDPEPANGILGVGDHLKLRFNEPIAGNYLDEDNNFQLLGVTNRSDIASSTSVYFDGTPSCGATSEVTRVLNGKSFSIDLMAKPANATTAEAQELFSHTSTTGGIRFGLEPVGTRMRLYGYIDDHRAQSQPLEPLTDFTRLIMTYNHETGRIRFYAGTQDVTDQSFTHEDEVNDYDGSAPLVFGQGYQGNMLEARLWLKVLSTDEIVATHEKRLTGYERKLAAYYPMNEGRGDLCYDKASGSTLTLQGASWTTPSGYSLQMNGQQAVTLAQDILSRSNIQDYTLMFWFRTTELNQSLFSAGWTDGTVSATDPQGTLVEMVNGRLVFHNGNMVQQGVLNYADGLWHHFILTVNRTYNNAAIYIDGQMINTFAADNLSGLSGVMMLGGDQYGQTTLFRGHIDDFVLFEQALPSSLIETYDNLTPVGDEMGLVALLPFSEQKENSNGIMEEIFSINNQRIFTLTDGTVVEKIQPLIIAPDSLTLTSMGDPSDHAPVRERDMLTKMNFDWSFNNDELLINLNMQDREINKNNIYVTVRNVEDLNGNRTVNPSMWQVFVNKNVLLWNGDGISQIFYEQADRNTEIPVQIMNVSGRRHQYTIDGMPDWLNVDQAYGSLNPQETQTLVFTVDEDLAVGVYSEIIYLTDENDLSEPLRVMIEVRAVCPWEEVSPQYFDRQMSLLGQVVVDGIIDTDPNDIVVAIANRQVVGFQHISYDNEAFPGYLFMTIYGNDFTHFHSLHFYLWQASTGRIFGLTTSQPVAFQNNTMVGMPPADPVILSTSANEVQYIDLNEGWNWISFNINPHDDGVLNGLFFTSTSFTEGDQIKSAATQQFAEWNGENWLGSLSNVDYHLMYMIYSDRHHRGIQVAGHRLSNNSERTISLHHGWNGFPYLLTATSGLTNALADYIEKASVGDIIKSQTQFAVFNADGHWMGSLTALVPGEGYLLYRNGQNTVSFTFYNNSGTKGEKNNKNEVLNNKPKVALPETNMTIIAKIDNEELRTRAKGGGVLKAYTGTTLAGVAEWQETDDDLLFFLTAGTDRPGQLTFFLEEEGVRTELFANIPLQAVANRHFGSLDNPILLTPDSPLSTPNFQAYPSVFTDHVDFLVSDLVSEDIRIIISNAAGMTVDETTSLHWANCGKLSAGVYFATLYTENYTATVKLVKVKR